jgi:hypothetical protein
VGGGKREVGGGKREGIGREEGRKDEGREGREGSKRRRKGRKGEKGGPANPRQRSYTRRQTCWATLTRRTFYCLTCFRVVSK